MDAKYDCAEAAVISLLAGDRAHSGGGGQGDINTHKQSLVLHAEPLEPLDTVGQLRRVYIQAQRRYEQCVKANCSHQNNTRHLPEDRDDML